MCICMPINDCIKPLHDFYTTYPLELLGIQCILEEMFLLSTCFLWFLVLGSSTVPVVRALVSTYIYTEAGMVKAQLPCMAIDHTAYISPGEIVMFWAKKDKDNKGRWRLMIVKSKDGRVMEEFRNPFMGTSSMGNHSVKYIHKQFYGRVNVTTPYGDLVIKNIKSEDAGQYLCHFKNMRTGDYEKAIVELIVFQAPSRTAEMNDTSRGNQTCKMDVIEMNSTDREKDAKGIKTNSTDNGAGTDTGENNKKGTNCTDHNKKKEENSNGYTGAAFWTSIGLNIVFGLAFFAYKFNLFRYIKRIVQANRGGPGAINADEIPIGDVNRNEGANDEEVIMNPQLQC